MKPVRPVDAALQSRSGHARKEPHFVLLHTDILQTGAIQPGQKPALCELSGLARGKPEQGSAGLRREHASLPEHLRDEILDGMRDGTPPGYEDMAAAYFRVLAEREGGR